MKRHKVIFKYLRTWFLLDVAAILPYPEIIQLFMGSENSDNAALKTPQLLRLLKIVRFVRILRIVRIFKLGKLMYKVEEYIVTDTLTSIIDSFKLLIFILYVGHWLACTFYFVGDYEATTEPLSWVTANDLLDSSLFDKYMTSFYWAFTTMTTVGYGDLTPNTNFERLFVMFGMIIACGVFAYSVGSIGTIVNKSNLMSSEFREKMLHINQFLIKKSIPNELRIKIMSYLDYLADYKREFKLEESEALEMLNDNLRDQVIAYLNGNMLNKSGVFQAFNVMLLSQIAFKLRHHTFSIDDPMLEEGHEGNTLYYISKGSAILLHKKTHTFIKELKQDSWVGELSFFTGLPRRATIRAKSFIETLNITKDDFYRTSKDDEDAMKLLRMIKNKIRKKKNLSGIGVLWYVWNKLGHISLDWRKFDKIKGNISRHLKKLRTDQISKDFTSSSTMRRNTILNEYEDAEYAHEQDNLIREAIK